MSVRNRVLAARRLPALRHFPALRHVIVLAAVCVLTACENIELLDDRSDIERTWGEAVVALPPAGPEGPVPRQDGRSADAQADRALWT